MILITGLTGTSGAAFYEILCRENYGEKIRVVVRESTDTSIFEKGSIKPELVVGNVYDSYFMAEAMKGCDTVFNIARKDGNYAVAAAVTLSKEVKKVIFVSSTIVYSDYYKNLKLRDEEERIARFFESEHIKYCFIRPTMIFGTPNDDNISQFIKWFKKFPVFPIVKKGRAKIQPVSRWDLAEAYWLILKNFDSLKENEYIVSGRECMTLSEMFEKITKACGKKVLFINIPFVIAKSAINCLYYLSFKKVDYREKLERLTEDRAYSHDVISNELGYSPRSFDMWLQKLVNEMK